MNISADELKKYKDYITYSDGYRIVFFYDNYHEVPRGLYAKEIEDFMSFLKKNNNIPKYISLENVIDKFLNQNSKALGAAIYNVDTRCIFRKNRDNVGEKINNSEVYKEELIYDYGFRESDEGYRIVYFYNDQYLLGPYCKNIEGFMSEFIDDEPFDSLENAPEFVSIDNLLNRYLNILPDISEIALYKVNGTCIKKLKRRNKLNML